MSGNFVLQRQPTEPVCTLWACREAGRSAFEARLAKSGGYLVIEPTEALTVIDVNTGKYDGSKNVEETFALINREAAQETARQIRLRNLSGIILIDFINQKDRQAAKELLEELRSLCKEDPVPVRVVDITALGLVELTRKKVKGTLAEQLKGLKPTGVQR